MMYSIKQNVIYRLLHTIIIFISAYAIMHMYVYTLLQLTSNKKAVQ